jgi:tRNA dimethylallyltransferase
MQLYRPLEILTARPGPDLLRRAPHHLFGILDASERASAASWRDLALATISANEAKLPIIVGGTGLYLRALMHGLADLPAVPPDIREAATARYADLGPEAFHAELARIDPQTASRLPPSDRQRLIRAWEIYQATGRSLGDFLSHPVVPPPDDLVFHPVVLMPPRPALYAVIDARVEAMVERGVLAEIGTLAPLDPSLPILKSVGAREFLAHINGQCSLAESVQAAQQATRHYAKRQTTWFRHQMADATQFSKFYNPNDAEIYSFIRQNLLTG